MASRFAVTAMPIIGFIVGFESLILLLQVAVNYCYVCYSILSECLMPWKMWIQMFVVYLSHPTLFSNRVASFESFKAYCCKFLFDQGIHSKAESAYSKIYLD